MKTIKVFETIDELLNGFKRVRAHGDEFVSIPDSVNLVVFSTGKLGFVGDDSDKFMILDLFYNQLVDRCLDLQNIRVVKSDITNEQK